MGNRGNSDKEVHFSNILQDIDRNSMVYHATQVFSEEYTTKIFQLARDTIRWGKPINQRTGKPIPRKAAWITDRGCNCSYTYSGTIWESQQAPKWFLELTDKVVQVAGIDQHFKPNACNANLYETRFDSVDWHADNEQLFDTSTGNVTNISLSLGATRDFMIKRNGARDEDSSKTPLQSGDLVIMTGYTQRFYQHKVPKAKIATGPRINFTWRYIERHGATCKGKACSLEEAFIPRAN